MSAKPNEEGINQWLHVEQFPEHLKKYTYPIYYSLPRLMRFRYWFQRYKIWENYDQGIWMTEDAWFGVTPEPIAK
jgi:trimethylguanosine synthase